MKLLVLYDNRAVSEEWVKGWGFSVLIENQDGESLLFDTGEKWSSLLKNMTAAKIDPMTIENLTFSHADWDHKGGAEGFLKVNREVNVFLPEFFPSDFKEILKNLGHAWEEVGTRPTELIKGVYATTSFYTEGKPAELGLVLKGSSGLSLVTGCAHPGIVRMVVESNKVFGEKIKTVVGGFHLKDFSLDKIGEIIEDLKKEGVEKFAPAHCTGGEQIDEFERICGGKFIKMASGEKLRI